MRKILITGANSYIGTAFEQWIKQNNDDWCADTLDMLDEKWNEKDFGVYDTIFHVAGIAHQKEKKENAHLYYKVNRDLAINVAKKAKAEGVKQFVILSSMSVYGMKRGIIYRDTEEKPVTHYGKSKYEADVAISQMQDENFVVSIMRPPMVYGKGCKGNYQLLRKLSLKTPFFPKIRNERSMIYIENLVSFVERIIKERQGGIFFPQNADYVTTYEMVEKIALCHGKKAKPIVLFNWMIHVLLWMRIGIAEKVFGTLVYEKIDLCDNVNFQKSIEKTEN